MRLLLDVIRCRALPEPLGETDFETLLKLAGEENVLPVVLTKLRAASPLLSTAQQRRLIDLERRIECTSFLWVELLKEVLRSLDGAGIPTISLKGPCLAERIYGSAFMRTCCDLDLLVRSEDRVRAERLLQQLRFEPAGRGDAYHRCWKRGVFRLELHHDVEDPRALDFDVSSAWSRAFQDEFHGTPVWFFQPSDELAYLCLHAVHHRFERMSLVLDLAYAFRRWAHLECLKPVPEGSTLARVVVLGSMMASHLDESLVLSRNHAVGEHDRRRLSTLAEQLWNALLLEQPPTLDWKAQHRFYLELEGSTFNRLLQRICHLRILWTRRIDEDFAFAQRFDLYRDWQVSLLRLVRLMLKTLSDKVGHLQGLRGQADGL